MLLCNLYIDGAVLRLVFQRERKPLVCVLRNQCAIHNKHAAISYESVKKTPVRCNPAQYSCVLCVRKPCRDDHDSGFRERHEWVGDGARGHTLVREPVLDKELLKEQITIPDQCDVRHRMPLCSLDS